MFCLPSIIAVDERLLTLLQSRFEDEELSLEDLKVNQLGVSLLVVRRRKLRCTLFQVGEELLGWASKR